MKQTISIIGGGTAGIMLASFLDSSRYNITIYDQKSSLGRKFLVAGDGGFNLTHSEQLQSFKTKYFPEGVFNSILDFFDNTAFRSWLLDLGIPTFVGSSGRVFPKQGIKPIDVLKAIESNLKTKGVIFSFNKRFTGWGNDNSLLFQDGETLNSDITVFSLGGGSWKVTGSDGQWLSIFDDAGIQTIPFRASNCGFVVSWPAGFADSFAGIPFKNIAIHHQEFRHMGEVVVTKHGLEGNAIYALSNSIQTELSVSKETQIYIDFKPMLSDSQIKDKLKASPHNTTKTLKDKLKLNKAQIALLKQKLTKEEYLDATILAKNISRFPVMLVGSSPLDEAISTMGGISLEAVTSTYELKSRPSQYCIGEMLDWNAPTGGYLIQGCASISAYLASILNKKKVIMLITF